MRRLEGEDGESKQSCNASCSCLRRGTNIAAAGVGRAARDCATLGAGATGVTAAAGWPASGNWSGGDGHGSGEESGDGGELHFDGGFGFFWVFLF